MSWFKHDIGEQEKQAIMSADHTTLLDGRVTLMQTQDGLRASMDSVLLASAVEAKSNERILDMGCGTGSVGLCVYVRHPEIQLNGVDIQSQMIDLATENAVHNKVKRSSYICGDVSDKSLFEAETFDHIVMNPPYYKDGERQQSPDVSREKAYTGDLDIWIASALHWVRQGGSLTLIHRADKLDEIISLSYKKFGAVEVFPIYSKPEESAKRVIVRMVRNRKTPLTLYPPVILFNEDGEQSSRAKSILRDGSGLI